MIDLRIDGAKRPVSYVEHLRIFIKMEFVGI